MDYSNLLKRSDLKATIQRVTILEIIDSQGHISVDDIYAITKSSLPNLSLATIYKNLLLMTDRTILVEVPISKSKSKYEIKKSNHIHLICEECGSIDDELLDDISEKSIGRLTQKKLFSLKRSQINLYGVCQYCIGKI